MKYLKKGDIVWAKLDGLGREQNGTRPCIVVQNDIGNRFSPTTIIVPLTRRNPKRILPTHLRVKGKILGSDFDDSIILTEQIKIIDVSRIISIKGKLPEHIINDLDKKMLISLGISYFVS